MQTFEKGFEASKTIKTQTGMKCTQMRFGCNENGIFRLPQTVNNRFYSLKKLKRKFEVINGKKYYYYRCYTDKISKKKIEAIKHPIDKLIINN